MSKSKKRITNEKRQRLGTGAGIAASKSSGSGGVPLWGWIVGGDRRRRGDRRHRRDLCMHQSSSSGQSASCVQSRLSKETLDPVSLPTWPANYDDLQCALNALGLKPSTEGQGAGVHYHVHLTLYVDGKQIEIPDYIGLPQAGGMTSTSTSEIHTHGRETDPTPGMIHIESTDAARSGRTCSSSSTCGACTRRPASWVATQSR